MMEQNEDVKVTPMMAQWQACKEHAKDALLLFRLGDFYEAFHGDAEVLAKELELTLTRRHEIPMSGIPHHTSEGYIDKLISKGYRVAIAEQIEDPKKGKGMLNREVVRVVTPGTLVNSSLLTDKTNNFFASFTQVGSLYGLAFVDLSTAEFYVSEFDNERDLLNELCRLRPAECLTSKRFQEKHADLLKELSLSTPFLLNAIDDWHFDHQAAHDFLINHFKVHRLDGFGLQGMLSCINAGGALMHHLHDTLCLATHHIQDVRPYSTSQYMSLDRTTQRNLELTESLYDGSRKNTLLEILDKTGSPMGGRLLRRWVKQPLLSAAEISKRQDGVQAFVQNPPTMARIKELLSSVRDIERLMMKISSGYATPRDLVTLRVLLPSDRRHQGLGQFLALSDAERGSRASRSIAGDDPPHRKSPCGRAPCKDWGREDVPRWVSSRAR